MESTITEDDIRELKEYRKTGLTPTQVQALFDENVALVKLVEKYIPDETERTN